MSEPVSQASSREHALIEVIARQHQASQGNPHEKVNDKIQALEGRLSFLEGSVSSFRLLIPVLTGLVGTIIGAIIVSMAK